VNKTIVGLALGLAAAGCPGGGTIGGDDGGRTGVFGGGDSDLASAARGSGVITLTSYGYTTAGVTTRFASASAGFGTPAMAPPCTNQTVENCTLSVCQPPPAMDGGAVTYPDSGIINITTPAKNVPLTPKTDGSYSVFVDTMKGLWTGGEDLNIATVGGRVPTFTTKIVAPTVAQISQPAAPAIGAQLMVDRSTDLVVKWNVGPQNRVQVSLRPFTMNGGSITVECNFPAYMSTGTIPASMLKNIPAGTGSFTIYTYNGQFVQTGDFDVTLTALTLATDSRGALVSYGAMYK